MNWHEQNEQARLAYATAKFVTNSGFARANCPFCIEVLGKEDRKQCLGIAVGSGWYKCWKCSTKGKIDIEDESPLPEAKPVEEAPKIGPPEDFMELGIEPGLSAMCTEDARRYLSEKRGLTDQSIWAAVRLGCCLSGRYGGRVVAPILGDRGEWLGWVARTWAKKSDKPYVNCPGMSLGTLGRLYNHAATQVQTEEPLLVVEGVFDALAVWPHGVAVLGKPTETQVMTLAKCVRPVVLVLDGDAWEQAWVLTARLRFEGQRAGYVRLPPRVDPDEVDRAWLREEALQALEADL